MMPGTDLADRSRLRSVPMPSDSSTAAEAQSRAPRRTTDGFSVNLVAAYEHDPGAAMLGVHGEIDLATAPRLREVLRPVVEGDTRSVVVDLSEVTFMDSTGVHVLLETLQRLAAQDRRLAIVCREGGQIHRLLATLGLLDTLTVHRSRDSALIGGDDLVT